MISESQAGKFTTGLKGLNPLRATGLLSLATGQIEQPGFELTRAGRRFVIGGTGLVTGIAPVQAWPTTAAQWAISNLDKSRSYAFESIFAYPTSGTPGVGGTLLGCFFDAPIQSGLAANAAIVNKNSGPGGSLISIKSAATITAPAAPAWFIIGLNGSPNVGSFPGSGFIGDPAVAGRLILQPGKSLGLAVLALAGTTPLFVPWLEWVELEVENE